MASPFDLDFFVKTCMKYERDFQAVLDIMAHQKGKEAFIENRYEELIKTAKPNKFYDAEFFPNSKFPTETIIHFKNGKKFYIPRTQEIITENLLAHILAIGLGKSSNIPGGLSAYETLKIIKNEGGYAILNHSLVCKAFEKEQVKKYFEEKLILGAEFNGGITIDSKLGEYIAKKFGNTENPPLKKENKSILDLEKKVLIIANDDSRCKSDVKYGAYTEYLVDMNKQGFVSGLVEAMQNEIKTGLNGKHVNRHDQYSKWFSLWYHGVCGVVSHKTQNPPMPAL